MAKVENIAKWFINELHPEPLKLQKLLYFAQGYSYAFYDHELFPDEFEAWVHGPVIPKIYFKYKDYSYNPIAEDYELEPLDEEVLTILNYVKNNYAKYDAKFLEELTHNEEPWQLARSGLDPIERSDKTIDKLAIANYFTNEIYAPMADEWD